MKEAGTRPANPQGQGDGDTHHRLSHWRGFAGGFFANELFNRSSGGELLRKLERATQMNVSREMPRYRCHKEVWALKIKALNVLEDGSEVYVVPEDEGYATFAVGRAYYDKHKPEVGGYYVAYDDGYKSYSPAAPFEAGYTLIR